MRLAPLSLRAVGLALGVFAVWIGWFLALGIAILRGGSAILDTPTYHEWTGRILAGELPYRDVAIEYPPGALLAFLAPRLLVRDPSVELYGALFMLVMALCGAGLTLILARALAGAPRRERGAALALVACSPLLLGNVTLLRFDLWAVAPLAGALWALRAGRTGSAAACLGLGIGIKLFPIALVPFLLRHVWRRDGAAGALRALGVLTATVGLCFAPFALWSPAGVLLPATFQAARPLQVESLAGSLLMLARSLGLLDFGVELRAGLQAIAHPSAEPIRGLATLAWAGALGGVLLAYLRGPASERRLLRYAAAVLVVLVAGDTTLSPQYLLWILPAVVLVPGRRGLGAMAVLAVAMVMTGSYFPDHYYDYVDDLAGWVSGLVVARNLALIALAMLLLWPERGAQEAA